MALSPESGQMRREQLDRVLASLTFQGAERSRTLLRFLVEQTLDDRADRLKEYTLGAEALGRGRGLRSAHRSHRPRRSLTTEEPAGQVLRDRGPV